MDIHVVVESTGRVKLRLVACDGDFKVHTRHVSVTNEQLKAIQELQEVEKPTQVSPWAPIFLRYFIRKPGSTLTGAQVVDLLKGLGYRSTKEQKDFREWVMTRGIEVKLGHGGSRTYYGLALRGSGSVDSK